MYSIRRFIFILRCYQSIFFGLGLYNLINENQIVLGVVYLIIIFFWLGRINLPSNIYDYEEESEIVKKNILIRLLTNMTFPILVLTIMTLYFSFNINIILSIIISFIFSILNSWLLGYIIGLHKN